MLKYSGNASLAQLLLLLLSLLLIVAEAASHSLYYKPNEANGRPKLVYLHQRQQHERWLKRVFQRDWWEFKNAFNRSYQSFREETARMQVFIDNMLYIRLHNERADRGLTSYRLGVNQFTDLTHTEFLELMTGFKRDTTKNRRGAITYISPATTQKLPDTVDWRQKGAVTPVKNQGQCGSCWTFSSTGALEGQHFRKTGVLLSLSEQQLVDCSGPYGTEGCNGGWMEDAFNYVKDYGIELEADYPYTGRDGSCLYRRDKVAANCTGVVAVPEGSEALLQEAVANVGPVSVAIDASNPSFQLYRSGVYNEPACSSTNLDHAVLVVGYGNLNGADYWLVKNSWGTLWGTGGYVQMSRNRQNQCGIASHARYPTV